MDVFFVNLRRMSVHGCWARHLCGTVHWVYLMLLEVWFVSRSATGDESNAYHIHKCYDYYYIKKCDNGYCQSCQWYLTVVIIENSIHSIPIRCLTMWRLSSCSLMLSSELWVHYNLNPHRWLRIKGAAQVNQRKGVAKTKTVRMWLFKPRCFEICWYIECSHFVFPAIKEIDFSQLWYAEGVWCGGSKLGASEGFDESFDANDRSCCFSASKKWEQLRVMVMLVVFIVELIFCGSFQVLCYLLMLFWVLLIGFVFTFLLRGADLVSGWWKILVSFMVLDIAHGARVSWGELKKMFKRFELRTFFFPQKKTNKVLEL